MIKRAYNLFYEREAHAIQEKIKKKKITKTQMSRNSYRRKENYSFDKTRYKIK